MEPQLEILPESQRSLWPDLGQIPGTFVLYGGTAIALHFGHRQSIDFDFFSTRPFDGNDILQLPLFATSVVLARTPGSLTLTVDTPSPVKFQFFGGLPLSRVHEPARINPPGIQLASPYDLFATKLKVIQDRADRKDYLDIAEFLKQGYDLARGLATAVAVYRNRFNPSISLHAAVSFFDGDLPLLGSDERHILEKAVADFWASRAALPEISAVSKELSI